MIRMIVTDLDGTLLTGYDAISEENLAAIHTAMAKGVYFAVASGRSAASCSHLLIKHGLETAHIIAANGAHTIDKPFGNTLSMHKMDGALAATCMQVFSAYHLFGCLYTSDAVVYNSKEAMEYFEWVPEPEEELVEDARKQIILHGNEAVLAALSGYVLKAFCCYQEGQEASFAAAKAECEALPGACITSSWHNNFEIMPVGVDKGRALRLLAQQLGIAREEIMAFGDQVNDLPMLTWAGIGVAMGNAQDSVKQAVPYITKRCDESGVAFGIYKWGN